ncbi:MAG: FecR family protein [Kofleriaceae bacterium]
MIDGVRPTDPFAKSLGAGTVLATGDGRVDLQFGEASAFALGPRSTLELRAFDARTITLVVDGTVDIEVAPRQPGQRFLVIAGDRTIEVRGTRFSVKHDTAGTLVSCQHGLVAVRDTSAPAVDTIDIATARKAFVPAGHHTGEAHAVPLTADELVTLASSSPWSTPGWTSDLVTRTVPLDVVAAAPHRAIRVDGSELGPAPFAMRVAPGRHVIETQAPDGKLRKAGWVDVTAAKPARFEALPIDDAPSTPVGNAIATRKRQLAAGLDHARLRQCTRRISISKDTRMSPQERSRTRRVLRS